jgi:OmpA-OmpF porin, OOP family
VPAQFVTSFVTTATVVSFTIAGWGHGAQPPAPRADEPNLLSFASGVILRTGPESYGSGWPARGILDDRAATGWASPANKLTDHVFVIELPERTELKLLSFDTGGIDGPGRGAKDVVVEMSDTSATAGFTRIAAVALKDKQDNQRTPATGGAGRWVRITVKNNNGATDYTELMEVRGYGTQQATTPFPKVSGTYKTNYGDFHIKQEGSALIGCYEHDQGVLSGGIEGRVMKVTWQENGGPDDRGPALMVFSGDAKQMFGLWWTKGNEAVMGADWDGVRTSDAVGSCPHMPKLAEGNAAKAQIGKSLAEEGRARVYGINFDTGSDVIRPESKGTLDQIAALLKENASLKMMIEGHTDSVGGEAPNKALSERRAASVKAYLVTAGTDASRLTTAGLGMSKPVASNADAIGRAQNRRVELVKQP